MSGWRSIRSPGELLGDIYAATMAGMLEARVRGALALGRKRSNDPGCFETVTRRVGVIAQALVMAVAIVGAGARKRPALPGFV